MTRDQPFGLTLLQRPEPIDWFMTLRDFDYAGHNCSAVARALGDGESTLRAIKQGAEPTFERGRAIVLLYVLVFSKQPPTRSFQAANEFS